MRPGDVRGFMVGLVSAGLVVFALSIACRPKPGCMAECPPVPAGCTRTSVDPGSCADSACSTPLPVCHYAPIKEDGAVCPPDLTGRCISP